MNHPKPQSLIALILGIVGVLIVLSTGQLCCYHALIAWTGETTNERILTQRKERRHSGPECPPEDRKNEPDSSANNEPLMATEPSKHVSRASRHSVTMGDETKPAPIQEDFPQKTNGSIIENVNDEETGSPSTILNNGTWHLLVERTLVKSPSKDTMVSESRESRFTDL